MLSMVDMFPSLCLVILPLFVLYRLSLPFIGCGGACLIHQDGDRDGLQDQETAGLQHAQPARRPGEKQASLTLSVCIVFPSARSVFLVYAVQLLPTKERYRATTPTC